jgi:hypothetical protein
MVVFVWIADFLHHCMSLLCWLKFGEFWAQKASRNYCWDHHDQCLRLGVLFLSTSLFTSTSSPSLPLFQ